MYAKLTRLPPGLQDVAAKIMLAVSTDGARMQAKTCVPLTTPAC